MSHKRHQDHYGKRARKEGFPARSVYKLEEMHQRARIFKPGMHVIDLGCFPGSWAMYASRMVQRTGYVVGIDIQEPEDFGIEHMELRQADIFESKPEDFGQLASFDVVMSDMAPNTSGHRGTDQARSYNLYAQALHIATQMLKPEGIFIAKIFQGPDFELARDETRAHFDKVRIMKPKAVRSESYECYILGFGFKNTFKTQAQS